MIPLIPPSHTITMESINTEDIAVNNGRKQVTTAAIHQPPSSTTNDNNHKSLSLAESSPSSSSKRIFLLGSLVYLTYFTSLAVPGQFLSLFYKSKGFGGSTMGVLSSLTPLTTFLMAPLWGMVMDDKSSGRISFPVLYWTILLSVLSQTSLIFLDHPNSMIATLTFYGIMHAPTKPMLDALIMETLDDRSLFGKVRLFGILGSGLGTSLGGHFLNFRSTEQDESNIDTRENSRLFGFNATTSTFNETTKTTTTWTAWIDTANHHLGSINIWKYMTGFNLLFVAHIILTIPTVILIRQLQILGKRNNNDEGTSSPTTASSSEKSTTTTNIKNHHVRMRDIANLIVKDIDHILFLLTIYIMGTSGGVGDTFTYLRFREVGCTPDQMGTSRMLSSIAGAIMCWFSGNLVKRLGRECVLVLSLFCGGLRFWLVQMMDHRYYGYLAETIRGAIFGAFWSSATIYASQMGPPSLRATMILLLNGVYNGIGRSTGAIVAGRIQAVVGTQRLFQYASLMNLAMGTFMVLYYKSVRTNSKTKTSVVKSKKER